MKIIIVGGGAAGLFTALCAKKSNNEVIILEKNQKCGKKLLITGNGHCNYFNENFTIDHYHSDTLNALAPIINDDNKEKILAIFEQIGIVPKVHNGYYYPVTNQAITVQNTLVREVQKKGVIILNDVEVTNIAYRDKFYITTNKENYQSDVVVLATGSKSFPKTGSDGLGYALAQNFQHNIIMPMPSLVALCGHEKYLKEWQGIRCDAKVSLFIDNQFMKEEAGELQLTNEGLSGIAIYQLSRMAVKALANHKVTIKINFLPWLEEDLYTYLQKRNNLLKIPLSELLDGMLNYKICNLILKKNKIDYSKYYDALNDHERKNLIEDLISFNFNVTGYKDFNSAQVCSGGVALDELNMKTMASLKQDNLYIVGELLDVDGECGGYNLGFAWLSGLLAGESIREKND